MKRIVCLTLTLALLLGCAAFPAAAEELVSVHCREQEFSTRMPADKSARWEEDTGLVIYVNKEGSVPFVTVYRRADKFKDPVNYLNNVYREYMENKHDNKVATNPCTTVEVAGKTLYAAMYHYEVSGNKLCLAVLIEVREDGDVQYSAKFVEDDGDETESVLVTAIENYLPDGAETAPGPETEISGKEVYCEEQGFTVAIPEDAAAGMESDGLFYIWLGDYGYVPNIYICRRQKKLNNPENYVSNVVTDYMKETYGDDLVSWAVHEYLEVGGKKLLGASYAYRAASGNIINQVFLVEVREDRDVEYTARFLNSEREDTLAALETVVRSYTPDGAEGGKQQAPVSASGAPLNATPAEPLITGVSEYKDGRFYISLPDGWKIMTQSDYMTFCFKAWDPRNPDRTVFLFMKLEPFLKSWKAQAVYKAIDDSLGGNSIYALSAYAPVMESCTLKGMLDAIPQAREYCERFYDAGLTISPNILPEMTSVTILEKQPSSLPAPDTCQENVIARISYEDYLGQPCEGLVTAQPLDTFSYDLNGVDAWPYTVYLFTGVTAPAGEMQQLEETLTSCLGSFGFEQSYVKKAIDISNEETRALLAQAQTMQAAHDAMVDAWYAREQSHDIAMQKWSDSFMGYDRLYDSSTGEVYLADVGFYDTYDLHRGEYANSNLYAVDASTQQYYLQAADYYISK